MVLKGFFWPAMAGFGSIIRLMATISPTEPVSQLRKVPIRECGEPLVNFLETCPRLVLERPQFAYRRETLIRESVAARLRQATESLPTGLQLAVLEGWRAPAIQSRMYRTMWAKFKTLHSDWTDASLRRATNKFVAPLDERVPPPHTTGGALDLSLIDDQGHPLDMISPYAANDALGFPMDAPLLSATARSNRRTLGEILASVGLTNYPSEFWHFSYGDQGWAYRGSEPFALYGAITPPEWEIDPKDVSEEPLVIVAGDASRASAESH